MRTAPSEYRSARPRRGLLVAVTTGAFASLLLTAAVRPLEPWLGSAHLGLLLLTAGAAGAAAAAWFGGRRAPAWSGSDDVAWVVGLFSLAVLAGTCAAPVGVPVALFATLLFALATQLPSPTLAVVAAATVLLLPVVRALTVPEAAGALALCVVASVLLSAFGLVLAQGRLLARALVERDVALAEHARAARPAPAAQTSRASWAGRAASASAASSSAAADDARSETQDQQGWEALVERVRSSVTVMAENAGVAASVQAELSGLAPPSNKIRVHLLRIAQEATTQALRHAEPRSIVVRLRRGEGGVVFELQDDGDANEATRNRRSIASLRGRVAALGGTAEVRRAEGGWVTRVRLPCEQLN